jgi:transcriptional regulator with XRE-family HTH domain
MSQLYERLASRVRQEREAANLSQSELADLAGLSRSQLANIENARQRPPLEAIYRISLGLQVKLDDLLPKMEEAGFAPLAAVNRVTIDGQSVPAMAANFLQNLDKTRA